MSGTVKRCPKCKQFKWLSEFHKYKRAKDGLQSYCKICQKIYQRKYGKTVKGKTAHHRGNKKYKKSKKGKVADKYSKINRPNQIKAINAVNHAIQVGKLPRPDSLFCKYCYEKAVQYHHPSYKSEHKLKVIPVCTKCHRKIHLKKVAI